jgi:hypothetical protein
MSTIQVQNISHTNGTSAATIDSDGRILTPARPSFYAYRTYSDQSDINYSPTETQVQFDATQHNIGNCYDTSNYKFTCPVSGVYNFSWQVRMTNVTTAGYVYTAIRKNGLLDWGGFNIYGPLEDPQGGTYQTNSTSATVQLSANDEIDVVFRISGDTSSRVQNVSTFFSGFLVG